MDDVTSATRIEELEREVATWRAQAESTDELMGKIVAQRDDAQKRVAELEAVNRKLVNLLWGRRSERRVPDPNQPLLTGAEDWLTAETTADEGVITAGEQEQTELDEKRIKEWLERRRQRRERKQERREELPAHLERRERLLDLEDAEKEGLKYIGDAVTERLRFERPQVYVERIVRRKYVVPQEPARGVLSRPAPTAIVPGCKYDFSVIATMLALKMAFHQPTYRQQDWFAQWGWFPSRSTINDLMTYSANAVVPLVAQMWYLLLQQVVVLVDETRLRLLTRGALTDEQLELLRKRRAAESGDEDLDNLSKSATKNAGCISSYAWLFTGLKGMAPYNLFHWSLTRQQSTLDEILRDYRGTVVGDAYDGYAHIAQRSQGRIVHAACNTHARREFVNAESYEPQLCARMHAWYRQLSALETRARDLPAHERQALRQRDAQPIWREMEAWLQSERVAQAAVPGTPFGKAIGYMSNQWHALRRYLGDGNLPMTNDQAEQTIRPLAVGRRNWLFLGHPAAAPGRLELMSVVSSAHRHHLMVDAYLEDILQKLAEAQQHHPQDLELNSPYLLDLLPDRWAAQHPTCVRQERVTENENVSERKAYRRACRRQAARAEAAARAAGTSPATG